MATLGSSRRRLLSVAALQQMHGLCPARKLPGCRIVAWTRNRESESTVTVTSGVLMANCDVLLSRPLN